MACLYGLIAFGESIACDQAAACDRRGTVRAATLFNRLGDGAIAGMRG